MATLITFTTTELHVIIFVYTAPEAARPSETAVEENNTMATIAKMSSESSTGPSLEQIVELFTNMSSVLELLSQAAQSSLNEQERRVY